MFKEHRHDNHVLIRTFNIYFSISIFISIFLCTLVMGEEPAYPITQIQDYTELSLEDLMNIEITSVSKRSQKLSEAAAAIFVITQEDIRRSGASNIPEVLRLAPGIHVACIDANKWAVTSRAFNGRFANKLLVLIDGRSVYTPLFSGVFWDVQDVLLEDIDRIEVIRGPGASLWGANAVNGVINIITKKTTETQGSLASIGGGTEEKEFGGVRYGAKINEETSYRVYAKYFNRDASVFSTGDKAADDWDAIRSGFRMDWQGSQHDSITFQGDIYDNKSGDTMTTSTLEPPYEVTTNEDNVFKGGNLLGRWRRDIPGSSSMAFQFYYDRAQFETSFLGSKHDTVDLDFFHLISISDKQEVMWGLGYRFIYENIDNSFYTSMIPDTRIDNLISAFIQSDTKFLDDRLCLTLGSKFEHNEYTGYEIQPNIRMIWSPRNDQSIWASISRAVRTPSHCETSGEIKRYVLPPETFDTPLPVAVIGMGDEGFNSETVIAYEIGYRIKPVEQLSLDIATFCNTYDNLLSGELGTPIYSPSLPYMIYPMTADNKMEGITYGVELSTDWRVQHWWRLQGAYTRIKMDLRMDSDSLDTASEGFQDENPHNLFSLRSSMEFPKGLEFDLWLRFADDLPGQHVKSYTTLDLRLGWKPLENIELSIVGQNLLDDQHAELKEAELIGVKETEVERSVYGKVTVVF